MNSFQFTNYLDFDYADPSGAPASSSPGSDPAEFEPLQADADLQFITRILLEEDVEDKVYMLQGDPALVAAEKPFLDILYGNSVPISPDGPPLYLESLGSPDHSGGDVGRPGDLDAGVYGNYLDLDGWPEQIHSRQDDNGGEAGLVILDPGIGGRESASSYADETAYLFDEIQSISKFNEGMEEASKFLPDSSKLFIDITGNGGHYRDPDRDSGSAESKDESGNGEIVESRGVKNQHDFVFDLEQGKRTGKDDDGNGGIVESRGVKNQHDFVFDLEQGRRTKQSATYLDDDVPKEEYDEVLLCNGGRNCGSYAALVKPPPDERGNEARGDLSRNGNAGKSKGRRQSRKEVVDLRSLLLLCAQSISVDDRLSANQQLKQIRQHSSSTGDGSERMAHYFADGLEARLAGIGSEIYRSHVARRRTSAADILKAFRVYIRACPFKKISHGFANQIILRVTRKAARIHIIDFGIGFGFHMPCLIQTISKRHSGPPWLRITGIDVPQPGFRPSERLEETGRRLEEYAREFNVPFEYHPIAKKWEDVKIEELNLKEDELLVVTCMHQLENVADETVSVGCPRDDVLNNIRKMKPAVFIHGTVNGAYSSPFFVTRFREALFHFSAIFDAFDCNVSREDPHRLILEKEILGSEALNVIACEGAERLHRPETYKQWQVRNQRCGFLQLPLDPEVMRICEDKIMSMYNKDFLIDTDGKWMVQGWKGRVLYAVSAWEPVSSRV